MSEPIAVVNIVAGKGGFEFEIINEDLPEATLADLLRGAANQLEGKDDRAAGMWGR